LATVETQTISGAAMIAVVIVVAGVWLFRDRIFGTPE
jgi:uncharacterized membrane protein YdcZ (DUF606 family)